MDAMQDFIPLVLVQLHSKNTLKYFVSEYIEAWHDNKITMLMTCGQKHMPRYPVEVYQFVPYTTAMTVQMQYGQELQSRTRVEKPSLALAMKTIDRGELGKCDGYIDQIVDHHLKDFSKVCWDGEEDDFPQKLFELMTTVKLKSENDVTLRDILRLIVVTYIMSHTLTIDEETKAETLSEMDLNGNDNEYQGEYISARLTNRQLKHCFSKLQGKILVLVLERLQQIIISDRDCTDWLLAFVTILGLCLALEDQQQTLHLVMETKVLTEGMDPNDAQQRAVRDCMSIDEKMEFIQSIFWEKYWECNPLYDLCNTQKERVGLGYESNVIFILQVAQLMHKKGMLYCVILIVANMLLADYLESRRNVSISPDNQINYPGRLVAKFLSSFQHGYT